MRAAAAQRVPTKWAGGLSAPKPECDVQEREHRSVTEDMLLSEGAQEPSFAPWRPVALGLGIVLIINVADTFITNVVGSSLLTLEHFPIILMMLYLPVIFLLNPFVRLLRGRALTTPELVASMVIGFLGAAIPAVIRDVMRYITSPFYFASGENQWAEYVLPYLPHWAIVGADSPDAREARMFYEGLRPGETIPWAAWFVPLVWWTAFIGVILFACVAMAVVLRRQWDEYERLPFPMPEVVVSLARGCEPAAGRRAFPSLLTNRVFLIGVAVPFAVIMWNGVGYFYSTWPTLGLMEYGQVGITRDFPDLYYKFDFYVIGFAYFTSTEILLSIWVFHILAILQIGITQRLGAATNADAGQYYQCMGALACFVFWGLWMARRHLLEVCRKAFAAAPEVDDSQELLSYRVAVWGLLLSLLFLLGWLHAGGMEYYQAALFLLSSLILYLGLAKVIAMSGLVSLRAPMDSTWLVLDFLGSGRFTPRNLAGFSLMQTMRAMNKAFAMPSASNAARLSDFFRRGKRTIGWAVVGFAVLGLVVCLVSWAYMGYTTGAQNWEGGNFWGQWAFNKITSVQKTPTPVQQEPLTFWSIGFLVMGLLSLVRYRVAWWPFHPVGFAIAWNWPIRASAFAVFLTWAAKMVILRVGGIDLYRRLRPFFLGMLVGYTLGITVSFLIDLVFFFGQGHSIHWPPM